jgi:hypothetical protein
MAETKIKEQNTYHGIYPTVFKKIDATDVNVNAFQTYKYWSITSGSSTSSMLPLQGIYSDPNSLPALGTNLTYNDAANIDGSLQTVTYFSINHFYYKYKTEPLKTFGPTNLSRTSKNLYESASIFSFPQIKIGEGIKPGSFLFVGNFQSPSVYGVGEYGSSFYGSSASGSVSISSDRYGNLIYDAYPTASIISEVKFYEGFNEYFDTSRITYTSTNVTYIPGIEYNSNAGIYGYQAQFDGTGYIKTTLDGLYDRNHDYAVSFFIQAQNTGSESTIILTKSTSSLSPQYPFKIELDTSNQIVFTVAGSTEFKAQITSSITVNSAEHHVVCQTTGSVMELWIDGTLHASASNTLLIDTLSPFTASARIDNADPLFIGGYDSGYGLTGTLDEIRIYNKSLSATEIGYLSDIDTDMTFMQTNHVGNVFSKQGIVVLSTPDYRFNFLMNNDYTISYRSTKTIYEMNVVAKIGSGDFNMSSNLTLTQDDDQTYKSFVSSSTFSPYVTTVGLYDGSGQLLAVGKLAQPIRKLTDVDMNLLVRIDLDRNIS